MLFLKPQGQGLFKFCITVQYHERQLPCIFGAEALYILDNKVSFEKVSQTFEWLGEISPKSSCDTASQFFFKLCITLHCQERQLFITFFSWNVRWFGQNQPIKVPNFRLSTGHVKFHQICSLIGSFCWKYTKFQLQKYKGVLSHDTGKWCKIWIDTDILFQKLQEFAEFWPEHSKFSKILLWLVPFE